MNFLSQSCKFKNSSFLKISMYKPLLSQFHINTRHFKNVKEDTEVDLDKPIKFSTSKASKSSGENLIFAEHMKVTELPVKYEVPVILGSLLVFMIYFLILREENDIDLALVRPVYLHSQSEKHLKSALQAYKSSNGDPQIIKEIEDRLAEIDERKKKK